MQFVIRKSLQNKEKVNTNVSSSFKIHENIAEKFLAPWRKNKDVLGAMLVGSYAVGLETPQSDIDLCIILKDGVRYWKRGDVLISGFIVEYAFYPRRYLKKLQEKDLKEGKRLRTRMLATGKILFDTKEIVKQIQVEARKLINRKLAPLQAEEVELRKYYLWDQLDNLRSLMEQHANGFVYTYYACLYEILAFYSAFLRTEIPRPARIHRFLTEEEFRKHYNIAPLPDTVFVGLFEKAMHKPSLQIVERLTSYVYENTGGFSINGWTLSGRT